MALQLHSFDTRLRCVITFTPWPPLLPAVPIKRSVLLTLYFSGYKIEGMGGACSTYGEGRDVYRVLVGKAEGRRPLERHRRSWEDNIKMDF
jgi:hypothetical protein